MRSNTLLTSEAFARPAEELGGVTGVEEPGGAPSASYGLRASARCCGAAGLVAELSPSSAAGSQEQFKQARQALARLDPRGAIAESYWWTAAYLANVDGDPEETRRCLRELLRLPEVESRRNLLAASPTPNRGGRNPDREGLEASRTAGSGDQFSSPSISMS